MLKLDVYCLGVFVHCEVAKFDPGAVHITLETLPVDDYEPVTTLVADDLDLFAFPELYLPIVCFVRSPRFLDGCPLKRYRLLWLSRYVLHTLFERGRRKLVSIGLVVLDRAGTGTARCRSVAGMLQIGVDSFSLEANNERRIQSYRVFLDEHEGLAVFRMRADEDVLEHVSRDVK